VNNRSELEIAPFAESRNAHNGSAATGTYSEDGEDIGLNGSSMHGSPKLANAIVQDGGYLPFGQDALRDRLKKLDIAEQ